MPDGQTIHVPAALLREYLDTVQTILRIGHSVGSGQDEDRLAWTLARGVTARMAQDPRFLRCLREQLTRVVPEDGLVEGLKACSLDRLLTKYSPGGFCD